MEIKDEHIAKLLLVYASDGTTLVCTDGNHYKFWNINYNKQTNEITTKWGRIGNKVQSSVMIPGRSVALELDIRISDKLNKGYEIFTDSNIEV